MFGKQAAIPANSPSTLSCGTQEVTVLVGSFNEQPVGQTLRHSGEKESKWTTF